MSFGIDSHWRRERRKLHFLFEIMITSNARRNIQFQYNQNFLWTFQNVQAYTKALLAWHSYFMKRPCKNGIKTMCSIQFRIGWRAEKSVVTMTHLCFIILTSRRLHFRAQFRQILEPTGTPRNSAHPGRVIGFGVRRSTAVVVHPGTAHHSGSLNSGSLKHIHTTAIRNNT